MDMPASVCFDYQSVPDADRDMVRDAAARIKIRMTHVAQDIIEVGNDLIIAKDKVGHGNFLPWLSAEFGMSERTARNFMNVAKRLGKSASLADLGAEALYLLAAPGTPEEVREEVAEKLDRGEDVTHKEIKDLTDKLAKEKEKSKKGRETKTSLDAVVESLRQSVERLRDENETFRWQIENPETRPDEPIDTTYRVVGEPNIDALMALWATSSPEAQARFRDYISQDRDAA